MEFTALHRALGRPPGPIDDDMIDEAVRLRIVESDDLDWKRQLPEEAVLAQSDTLKDIAAMANIGGGVLVFGVAEQDKQAIDRIDVGHVSETWERTLRRVAVSGVTPPVFNLGVHRVGSEPLRALAVVVPASVDAPHLIYRGDYFGAPTRNNADTEWMKERQLESLYRARLDQRRSTDGALAELLAQTRRGTSERAWYIGVAKPRSPIRQRRLTKTEAKTILDEAWLLAAVWTTGLHPIGAVDRENPRIGLRRWLAPPTGKYEVDGWNEAWVSVHDDGSVTLAVAAGGGRDTDGQQDRNVVDSGYLETCTADLFAMIRVTSGLVGAGDYESQITIDLGDQFAPLVLQTVDRNGNPFAGSSVPLSRYFPITSSIRVDIDSAAFLDQLCDVATDVVNQGGINTLQRLSRPSMS